MQGQKLDLDDPNRLLVDEENVVRRTDISLVLANGDPEADAEVDRLLVLNDPPPTGTTSRRSFPRAACSGVWLGLSIPLTRPSSSVRACPVPILGLDWFSVWGS